MVVVINQNLDPQKHIFALGRFVLEFSIVERNILDTLTTICAVPALFTRAALSGVRTDAAIGYLTRYFQIAIVDPKDVASVEEVAERLTPLNAARNLILHHGIEAAGIGLVATDRLRALTDERTKTIPVSASILDEMTDDLQKINFMLLAVILNHHDIQLADDPSADAVLKRPWRYTPPPQSEPKKRKDQKNQPRREGPKRPL